MARYTTKLTRKGQMTVPADVRRELGLCEGDRITVTSENGVVTIRRAENVAERTAGIFHKYAIFPPPSAEELREMAAEAWTQDAIERGRASKEPQAWRFSTRTSSFAVSWPTIPTIPHARLA